VAGSKGTPRVKSTDLVSNQAKSLDTASEYCIVEQTKTAQRCAPLPAMIEETREIWFGCLMTLFAVLDRLANMMYAVASHAVDHVRSQDSFTLAPLFSGSSCVPFVGVNQPTPALMAFTPHDAPCERTAIGP
jgi:hypothetical protein